MMDSTEKFFDALRQGVRVSSEYHVADESMLRGHTMLATVGGMAKTEQVRIPKELADNARIVATAFGQSLPEYVTKLLEQSVVRDFPKAAKIVAKKAEQSGKPTDE
jgi:hypothetical protein